MCHVSCVRCQVAGLRSQVTGVMCHVSGVIFQLNMNKYIYFSFYKERDLFGEGLSSTVLLCLVIFETAKYSTKVQRSVLVCFKSLNTLKGCILEIIVDQYPCKHDLESLF